MNDQWKIEIAKISNELWNDHLWYRQLSQEEKDSIAHTFWLIRNERIKGRVRFVAALTDEVTRMLHVKEVRP